MSARSPFQGSSPHPENSPKLSASAPLVRVPDRIATGMRARWKVTAGDRVLYIDADEVEISSAGVLAFFRVASRMEIERTLLIAFSAHAWQLCERDAASPARHPDAFA